MEKVLIYGGFMKKLILTLALVSATIGASMETAILCKKSKMSKVAKVAFVRFVIKKAKEAKKHFDNIDWSELGAELPITP